MLCLSICRQFEDALVQGLVVIAKRQYFLHYRNTWLLYKVGNKSHFQDEIHSGKFRSVLLRLANTQGVQH